MKEWLLKDNVQKLVLIITGSESKDVLERWVFNVETDKKLYSDSQNKTVPLIQKSKKEITNEIQAIIRQITASVTFLPLLEESCTFDLLVYTDHDVNVPHTWEESDPKCIRNATDVKLRSFSTKIHKIDACVSFKAANDDDI